MGKLTSKKVGFQRFLALYLSVKCDLEFQIPSTKSRNQKVWNFLHVLSVPEIAGVAIGVPT